MTIDLDELERLAKAATPGPWELECPYDILLVIRSDTSDRTVAEQIRPNDHDRRDMAFIAATNPVTVLALVARVRKLEQRLATETQWGSVHD